MWGTWWQWGDARLTSMFVLLLLYVGYLAVWQAVSEPARAARIAAIVAIVGFINVPVVKFSVDWWSTLHQPASVFRMGGPTIHASLLKPLGIMAAGYAMLFLTLWLATIKSEILSRRIHQMQIAEAQRA
jgi:heme exporter protein C